MGSDRKGLVCGVSGVLLVAGGMLLGAMSVAEGVAMALGTIGVVVIAYAAWPRDARGAVAISWLSSFAAAIALLWLEVLDVLQMDPPALAATFVCIMAASLVALRFAGSK